MGATVGRVGSERCPRSILRCAKGVLLINVGCSGGAGIRRYVVRRLMGWREVRGRRLCGKS